MNKDFEILKNKLIEANRLYIIYLSTLPKDQRTFNNPLKWLCYMEKNRELWENEKKIIEEIKKKDEKDKRLLDNKELINYYNFLYKWFDEDDKKILIKEFNINLEERNKNFKEKLEREIKKDNIFNFS